MKLYTYSTARQRLADVLEEASREGQVRIRRQDGRVYAVMPVTPLVLSPFANVRGGAVSSTTSRALLRALREEGWKRGVRMTSRPAASAVPRARRRAR
jgi:hypothetical protein